MAIEEAGWEAKKPSKCYLNCVVGAYQVLLKIFIQ